jgi:hypothetical protein
MKRHSGRTRADPGRRGLYSDYYRRCSTGLAALGYLIRLMIGSSLPPVSPYSYPFVNSARLFERVDSKLQRDRLGPNHHHVVRFSRHGYFLNSTYSGYSRADLWSLEVYPGQEVAGGSSQQTSRFGVLIVTHS